MEFVAWIDVSNNLSIDKKICLFTEVFVNIYSEGSLSSSSVGAYVSIVYVKSVCSALSLKHQGLL